LEKVVLGKRGKVWYRQRELKSHEQMRWVPPKSIHGEIPNRERVHEKEKGGVLRHQHPKGGLHNYKIMGEANKAGSLKIRVGEEYRGMG